MSNGPTPDWNDPDKKRDAILRVLRHIVANPAAGQNCLGNDAAAHALFENPEIGNIKIPPGARVVMLPTGEEALRAGSSLIIELPGAMPATPSDSQLLGQVLGNYRFWAPH
jgi:hypothetical protein